MEKTRKTANYNFKNILVSVCIVFISFHSYPQNNTINEVIVIDSTLLTDNPNSISFNNEAKEWTIEPNKHDIFVFKVLKEVSLEDISTKHKTISINSFIDDSIYRYEEIYGKKPEPPYFGGTHIETMYYKNLYLRILNSKENYYKVSIKYIWRIE